MAKRNRTRVSKPVVNAPGQLEFIHLKPIDRVPPNLKTMHVAFGRKAGETCGTCYNLIPLRSGNKKFFKCRLTVWTHSERTDWRKSWAACGKWEAKKIPEYVDHDAPDGGMVK